ncbi:MAG: hypothetical protein J7J93_01475 [Candidatus Aenigmarchaeota archaeon]|nr:hypothetical protein [Candidatus Aenigmarchaeota archaeon]
MTDYIIKKACYKHVDDMIQEQRQKFNLVLSHKINITQDKKIRVCEFDECTLKANFELYFIPNKIL